jgi:hypothetical protein
MEPNERLQLWVVTACYQHETPKKKTDQVTGVVLADASVTKHHWARSVVHVQLE